MYNSQPEVDIRL